MKPKDTDLANHIFFKALNFIMINCPLRKLLELIPPHIPGTYKNMFSAAFRSNGNILKRDKKLKIFVF